MKYYWLSFSRIVKPGEDGNLGAVIITHSNDLSRSEAIQLASDLNLVPAAAVSIEGGEITKEVANAFPHYQIISREDLLNREDVVHEVTSLPVCKDCASKLEEALDS